MKDCEATSIRDPHAAPGRLFWLGLAGMMLLTGVVAWLQYQRRVQGRMRGAVPIAAATSQSSTRLIADIPLADFALTDQDGNAVTRDSLIGRVWVADIIFTYCGSICPRMTLRMKDLQERLAAAGLENVLCISISVDPQRDTPQRLQDYAREYKADLKRWWFLTGDQEYVHRFCREGLKLGVAPGADDDGDKVIHSSRFVLVDARGHVRGYYDTADDDADLAEMMQTTAELPRGSMTDTLLADIRRLQETQAP